MADSSEHSNGSGSLTFRWVVALFIGAAAWLAITVHNRVQRDIEAGQLNDQRLWEESRRQGEIVTQVRIEQARQDERLKTLERNQ